MRGWMGVAAVLAVTMAGPVRAEGERAGDFDYYVLSLGWSATWCALTGDERGDPQCDPGRDLSFTLHGLWPQFEQGWPSWCRSGAADPSRRETAAMADIMGGTGLAWHQWKKHGRCTGLSAAGYFGASRKAYQTVTIPPVLAALDRDVTLPASVVEEAFLESNPALSAGMLTVTCEDGMIDEVRICLTRGLEPRACAPDTARDCRLTDAVMEGVR